MRGFQLSLRNMPSEYDHRDDPIELTLRVQVAADGSVAGSEVVSSNVGRRLARTVQRDLRNCTFNPARVDDKPVAGATTIALHVHDKTFVAAKTARCPFPEVPRSVSLPEPVVYSTIRVHIDANAVPTRTELLQTSSVEALDKLALAAMMKCRPLAPNERQSLSNEFFDIRYEWR